MNQNLPRVRLNNENSIGLLTPVHPNSRIIIKTIVVLSLYGQPAPQNWILDLTKQQLTLVVRYCGPKGADHERRYPLLPLAGTQHRQPVFDELQVAVNLPMDRPGLYTAASVEISTAAPEIPFEVEIVYESVNEGQLLLLRRMNHLSFGPFLNTLIEFRTLNWEPQYGVLTNSLIGSEKKTDTTYALVRADNLPLWRAARDSGDEEGMKQYVTSMDIREIISATLAGFK